MNAHACAQAYCIIVKTQFSRGISPDGGPLDPCTRVSIHCLLTLRVLLIFERAICRVKGAVVAEICSI